MRYSVGTVGKIAQAFCVLCLVSLAAAFQSIALRRCESILSVPQPTKPGEIFLRRQEELECSVERRRFRSICFSESSPSFSELSREQKTGVFRRMQTVLLFPLKYVVFGPWRLFSRLLTDDRNYDDRSISKYTDQGELGGHICQTPLPASTGAVDELCDVSVMSRAINEDTKISVGTASANSGELSSGMGIAAHGDSREYHYHSTSNQAGSIPVPRGDRWAVASKGTDLSGNWQVVVSDQFKSDYDNYLANLGQPLLVRNVALGIVGRTTEDVRMTENGKHLLIRGKNARGVWERSLVSSGAMCGIDNYTPLHVPVMTADSEKVKAESWWESKGTVHVSWLRGVSRYHGGGCFESRRYLEDDGETYTCESTFHFNDKSREPTKLTWRFRRME